jgi:hypothetical protein
VISSGATLTPGDNGGAGRGELTFKGNLALNNDSQTQLQVATRTATAGNFGGNVVATAGYQSFLTANLAAWNSSALGDHDALHVIGTLSLGKNSSGLIQVLDDGYSAHFGDVIDLGDWTAVAAGSFDAGTNYRTGGLGGGDLLLPDLPLLGPGAPLDSTLVWDVHLFLTDGILIVVPEPSRAGLVLVAFSLIFLRRRRR